MSNKLMANKSQDGEQSQDVDRENGNKKEDKMDCIQECLKKHPRRARVGCLALIVIIAFLVAVTLHAVSWTSEGDTRFNLDM